MLLYGIAATIQFRAVIGDLGSVSAPPRIESSVGLCMTYSGSRVTVSPAAMPMGRSEAGDGYLQMNHLVQARSVAARVAIHVEVSLLELRPPLSSACGTAARDIIGAAILAEMQGDISHLARLGQIAFSSSERRAFLLQRIDVAKQRGAPNEPTAVNMVRNDAERIDDRFLRLSPDALPSALSIEAYDCRAASLVCPCGAFGVRPATGAEAIRAEANRMRQCRRIQLGVDGVLLGSLLDFWRAHLGAIRAAVGSFLSHLPIPDIPLDRALLNERCSFEHDSASVIANDLPIIAAIASSLAVTGKATELEVLRERAHTTLERRRGMAAFVQGHAALWRQVPTSCAKARIAQDLRLDTIGFDTRHAHLGDAEYDRILTRFRGNSVPRITAAIASPMQTLDFPSSDKPRAIAERDFAERLRKDLKK